MNCVTLAAAFLALLSSAKTAIADPVQEAAQCVAHRQLARAEELIVSQMMTTPRDPDLLTLLAEVRLDQNRGPEALELIGNAEQLGGITALRAQLEGLCHLAVGRLEPAERCFRTAIRLDPNYDAAHYFLARLLYNRNRFDEAIAESNRTIDLSPGFVRAYENLGLCYEGMQQLDQAERWYLEAIRRSSAGGLKTEWPRLDLATMLIHNDRLAEAKPYIAQAIEINPANAESWFEMGILFERSGDVHGALEQFRKAIQLDPHVKGAAYRAGLISEKLGNKDQAQKYFAQVRTALEEKH